MILMLRRCDAGGVGVLGVLGGMGPLATVDFLEKLITETKSATDQRHIPTVTWSVPQIPDRSSHIINGGESPFPELRRGLLNLQSMGASAVAMPCNTAHFWHDSLVESTGMKILHIVDAVVDQLYLAGLKRSINKVGMLATTGTVYSGIYQQKLMAAGYEVIVPTDNNQNAVTTGIGLTKSGKLAIAKEIFLKQIDRLKMCGADMIILACTEIPAVIEDSDELIDSNRALARRCVAWFDATYNGIFVDMGHVVAPEISTVKPASQFNSNV
ncbi:MAG: aspartate racemase [Candidatus Endobugula sp.]|jgi:aspartate racemase